MAVCQNLVPLVNIKIAGKWMFIPLKIVLIGIDPYPYISTRKLSYWSFFMFFQPTTLLVLAHGSTPSTDRSTRRSSGAWSQHQDPWRSHADAKLLVSPKNFFENGWSYLPKMVILPSKDGHFASKHAGGVFCDVFLPAKAWWFLFEKKTRCLSQHKLWLYEQRWGF